MKEKAFFVVFEGLSFGGKKLADTNFKHMFNFLMYTNRVIVYMIKVINFIISVLLLFGGLIWRPCVHFLAYA